MRVNGDMQTYEEQCDGGQEASSQKVLHEAKFKSSYVEISINKQGREILTNKDDPHAKIQLNARV